MKLPRWAKAGALAISLAGTFNEETLAARKGPVFDQKALLYDISLGSFSTEKSAKSAEKDLELRIADPLLNKFVHIQKRDKKPRFHVQLDLNADKKTADAILEQISHRLEEKPILDLNAYFYSEKNTQNRFANILVDESFEKTIAKYTTAFGEDISKTKKSLLSWDLFQDRGFSEKHIPKKGDIIPIPVRFLRDAYQLGMEDDVDVHRVEIKRVEGQRTLWDIASNFTEGDVQQNVQALIEFNDIRTFEVPSLYVGTPILIPSTIYRNPADPSVVESVDKIDVVYRPRPVKKESIDRELEKRIPEFKEARKQAKKHSTAHDEIIIRGSPFYVLKNTRMPSVLLEGWNLKNKDQTLYYSDRKNLDALAQHYADGISAYDKNIGGKLELVILDDGHGDVDIDPGTSAEFNGKLYREGDFTEKLQKGVAARLRSRGLKVVELTYDGRPGRKGLNRLNHFVSEANNSLTKYHLSPNQALYVSIHIDSHRSSASKPLPRAHVYRNPSQQALSTKAAKSILAETSELRENGFR